MMLIIATDVHTLYIWAHSHACVQRKSEFYRTASRFLEYRLLSLELLLGEVVSNPGPQGTLYCTESAVMEWIGNMFNMCSSLAAGFSWHMHQSLTSFFSVDFMIFDFASVDFISSLGDNLTNFPIISFQTEKEKAFRWIKEGRGSN